MPPCVFLGPQIQSIGCCGGSVTVYGCRCPSNTRFVCIDTPNNDARVSGLPACYTCQWRKEPVEPPPESNFNFSPPPVSNPPPKVATNKPPYPPPAARK